MSEDQIIFNSKARMTPEQQQLYQEQKLSGQSKSDTISFDYKPVVLSKERYDELAKRYEVVVINDFDDEYNMTEEERVKKFQYYHIFSKVKNVKKKFNRLGEFVRVFRLYMDCLYAVAEDNWVYPKEEFIKKVLKGKIKVTGIRFPKYKGRNAKRINWDYVAEYILDTSLDPKELEKQFDTNKEWDFNREESFEESVKRLFTRDELIMLKNLVEEEQKGVEDTRPIVDEDDAPDGVVFTSSKKDAKKLIKEYPALLYELTDLRKQERRQRSKMNRVNSFAFELNQDDFDAIAKIDEERGFVSTSDVPVFTGDIMNDDDYHKYLYELEQYQLESIKFDYEGKKRTLDEIREIELKNDLERDGWNVKALYGHKDKEKKLKKAYKKQKKREERLKKELVLEQKKTEKKGKKIGKKSEITFNAKEKDKKKAKKKKKKKNKESD